MIIYTYLKYLSHSSLLALRAVIFYGENYRVGWANKGTPIYRFHHRAKRNFCSEGMTVINEWWTVVSIPAVQFHASTSGLQDLREVIAFRYFNDSILWEFFALPHSTASISFKIVDSIVNAQCSWELDSFTEKIYRKIFHPIKFESTPRRDC